MKYYFFYIFLCIFLNQNAQNKELDSLKNIVVNSKKADTNYVNLRLLYATKRIYLAPDSIMLQFNEETLRISKDLAYDKGTISALEKVAIMHQYFLLDPFKALDYYQEGISLIESDEKFKQYKISYFSNIGTIYLNMQDYEMAIKSFNKVLEDFPNDHNVIAGLATAHAGLKEYEKAIDYFNTVEKTARLNSNYPYLSNILSNKSFALLETQQYDKAITSIEECLALINKYNIEFIRFSAYINASTIYLQTKNYEKAEYYADLGLELVKNSKNIGAEYGLWEAKTNIYSAKNDYKNALKSYHKAIRLKDSITSADRKLEISRKEIQFKADKETAIAEEEVKRQKLKTKIYLFGSIGLAIMAIIGFIIYRRRQKIIARAKEAEFKANISETELKALRSQLNPHFIYNALNSIGDYIIKNNSKKASEYLAIFADLMRDILFSSRKEFTSLKKDIDILKTYMDIEKMRNQNKFDYIFNIADNLDSEIIQIPPLLAQPIIENSIKHAFSETSGQGKITVNIKPEESLLIYEVDDNGKGRNSKNMIKNEESLGLKITKSRIDIINQQKNTSGYLKIMDKGNGTKVIIAIPLIKNT